MDDIIASINARITEAIQGITEKPIMIEKIAEPVIIRDQEEQSFPAIIDQKGECNISLFDDQYAIGAYHKMTQINYPETAAKGYGDDRRVQRVAVMSLVVYGDRGTADHYELADELRKAIEKTVYKNRKPCSVTSVNYNRALVFAGEFGGIAFFLQPHVFLFRINYRITTAITDCTKPK